MKTLAAAFLVALLTATAADKAFYLGTWKITSAAPAPWASSERKPALDESKTLVNQLVTIQPHRILGPRQVACPDPKFNLKLYPADMLFQGSFADMKERDKSVDISKAAASAGFRVGANWRTLETGCETEVDFHFIDTSTAAFGLNNVIYTLKKQP